MLEQFFLNPLEAGCGQRQAGGHAGRGGWTCFCSLQSQSRGGLSCVTPDREPLPASLQHSWALGPPAAPASARAFPCTPRANPHIQIGTQRHARLAEATRALGAGLASTPAALPPPPRGSRASAG